MSVVTEIVQERWGDDIQQLFPPDRSILFTEERTEVMSVCFITFLNKATCCSCPIYFLLKFLYTAVDIVQCTSFPLLLTAVTPFFFLTAIELLSKIWSTHTHTHAQPSLFGSDIAHLPFNCVNMNRRRKAVSAAGASPWDQNIHCHLFYASSHRPSLGGNFVTAQLEL